MSLTKKLLGFSAAAIVAFSAVGASTTSVSAATVSNKDKGGDSSFAPYLTANLPAGWTLEEVTRGQFGATGFVGFKIRNQVGNVVFTQMAAEAVGGGSTLCDIEVFKHYFDENPNARAELEAQIRAVCGDPDFVLPAELITYENEMTLLGTRVRRTDGRYNVDFDTTDSYFSFRGWPVIVMRTQQGSGLSWQAANGTIDNLYNAAFTAGISDSDRKEVESIINTIAPVSYSVK